MGLKHKSDCAHGASDRSSKRLRAHRGSRVLPIVDSDSSSEHGDTPLPPICQPANTQRYKRRRLYSRRDLEKRGVAIRNDSSDSDDAAKPSRQRSALGELESELADLADYNKPPVPASRRHHNSKDTHSNSSESEYMSRKTSRSKRKSVKADCTSSTSKRTALKDKLAAELAGFADFNKPPVPLSHRYHASAEVDSKSSEIRRAPKNAIKADRQSRSQKSSKRIHRVEKSRIIKPNMKAERINRRNLKAEVEQLEPWHDWVQELKRNPVAEEEDDDDDDDESPKCHRRNYPPRQKGVQNVPWSALSGEIRNMIYQQVMENDEKVRPTLTHYPNGIPRRTTRGFGDGASENFPQSSWGFTQTTRQIREELTPWLLDTRRVRTRLSTVNEYVDTFQRRDGKPRLGWIEPFCCGMPLPAEGVEVLNLIENHHRSSKFYLQLESTPTQLSMLELHEVNDGQEMWLLRSLSENYHLYANDSLRRSAVRGIRIAPYMKSYGRSPKENPDDEGISDRMSADGFLVKLDIQQVALQGKNEMELSDFVESIEDFIETSGLGLEHGLRIQARLGKYVASWHIDRKGLMHSSWCRMRR